VRGGDCLSSEPVVKGSHVTRADEQPIMPVSTYSISYNQATFTGRHQLGGGESASILCLNLVRPPIQGVLAMRSASPSPVTWSKPSGPQAPARPADKCSLAICPHHPCTVGRRLILSVPLLLAPSLYVRPGNDPLFTACAAYSNGVAERP
jgi:hypothetical protein